jgi:hypothetical protein
MKRILPLLLSGAAFIIAFPPALKAQEINIGVAIADGQKTTLSQSGTGQSQRAKSFPVEFAC